jgi:hypothetical protein
MDATSALLGGVLTLFFASLLKYPVVHAAAATGNLKDIKLKTRHFL